MDRGHTENTHSRRKSGVESIGMAEPDPRNRQSNRYTTRYGLILLFVALGVGLAAALFLTVGTANADSALEAECSSHSVFMTGAKSDGLPLGARRRHSLLRSASMTTERSLGDEPKSEPAEIAGHPALNSSIWIL